MPDKKKHLGLFMSNGIGLSIWKETGSLDRELALYRALNAFGLDVTIFTYDGKDYPVIEGDISVRAKGGLAFLRGRLNMFYGLLLPLVWIGSGKKLNIIMTNQAHAGWPAMLAKVVWGTPLVARSGYVFGEKGQKGLRVTMRMLAETAIYKVADTAIVPTEELKSWVVGNYGISPEKIHVIPNYVDTEVFQEKENIAGNSVERCVVMVGRLNEIKRIDLVIRALSGMECSLVLVGKGEDKGYLDKLAQQENVKIKFMGTVDNKQLPLVFNDATIYACTSKSEGHPKALIEAMGCGMPCLGTKSPGIENIIRDNDTGVLTDGSVEAIREGLQCLLDNPGLRETVGKKAAEFVRENYALEKIAMRYRDLLSRHAR